MKLINLRDINRSLSSIFFVPHFPRPMSHFPYSDTPNNVKVTPNISYNQDKSLFKSLYLLLFLS